MDVLKLTFVNLEQKSFCCLALILATFLWPYHKWTHSFVFLPALAKAQDLHKGFQPQPRSQGRSLLVTQPFPWQPLCSPAPAGSLGFVSHPNLVLAWSLHPTQTLSHPKCISSQGRIIFIAQPSLVSLRALRAQKGLTGPQGTNGPHCPFPSSTGSPPLCPQPGTIFQPSPGLSDPTLTSTVLPTYSQPSSWAIGEFPGSTSDLDISPVWSDDPWAIGRTHGSNHPALPISQWRGGTVPLLWGHRSARDGVPWSPHSPALREQCFSCCSLM